MKGYLGTYEPPRAGSADLDNIEKRTYKTYKTPERWARDC
jgi:hypothetical protein